MRWADLLVLAFVDLVARLAVPGSLLLLTHGAGSAAVVSAALVAVLAVVRGLWGGRTMERAVVRVWVELVHAVGARSVVDLHVRPKEQAVVPLLTAAREEAMFRAAVVPKVLANGAGLAIVASAVAIRLGGRILGTGAAAVMLIAVLSFLAQRRVRGEQNELWDRLVTVARDVEALLDAAAELRAHGREAAFVASVLGEIRAMARAEKRANAYSSLVSLFPVGVVLASLAGPLHAQTAWLVGRVDVRVAAEMAVLGISALAFAMGLASSADEAVRSMPGRRALATFLLFEKRRAASGSNAEAAGCQRPAPRGDAVDLRAAEIELDAVTITYPGAKESTPLSASHRWVPCSGLAVMGDNGAGKTSLALALLGLIEPSSGHVFIAGQRASNLDWESLRGRVSYMPQQPFVSAGASVAWHMRLVVGREVPDDDLRRALEQVGLIATLEQRALEHGSSRWLDVPAGELSGGELRRMLLARALVGNPQLVILDEPEAGLDVEGRIRLREIVTSLAKDRRVLLLAHDPSVIPDAFGKIACKRGLAA